VPAAWHNQLRLNRPKVGSGRFHPLLIRRESRRPLAAMGACDVQPPLEWKLSRALKPPPSVLSGLCAEVCCDPNEYPNVICSPLRPPLSNSAWLDCLCQKVR